MGFKEILGWSASVILLGTILQQIYSQYKQGSAEGVSWFLFVGQIIASIAFITYSVLVGDLVFIITNSLLLLSHFCGLALTYWQKTTMKKGTDPSPSH